MAALAIHSKVTNTRQMRHRLTSRSAPPAYGRRSPVEEQNAGTNLFVTGLATSLRDDELRELFAAHGDVEQASIVRDPHSRDSRGFGFVNMMTPEDADAVIEKLNGHELAGRNISIEKAKRNRPRTPTPGRYQGPPKRGMYQSLLPRLLLHPALTLTLDMRRGGYGDRRGPPRRDDYRGGGGGGYPRSGDRYSGERGGDRYERGDDRRYRDRSDGYGSRGADYGRRDDRDRGYGGGRDGGGREGGGRDRGYGYRDDGYGAAPPSRSYDDRR